MGQFKIQIDLSQWRLFIDSSNKGLKVVLLNNDVTFAPILVDHSIDLKETKNLKTFSSGTQTMDGYCVDI